MTSPEIKTTTEAAEQALAHRRRLELAAMPALAAAVLNAQALGSIVTRDHGGDMRKAIDALLGTGQALNHVRGRWHLLRPRLRLRRAQRAGRACGPVRLRSRQAGRRHGVKRAAIALAVAAATSAHAIGVAGVAARGGIHRHCDDACLYRLDQAEAKRAAEKRERELRIEAEHARQMKYRQRPPLGDPYTPPPPRPPGAHADAMSKVNILKGTP